MESDDVFKKPLPINLNINAKYQPKEKIPPSTLQLPSKGTVDSSSSNVSVIKRLDKVGTTGSKSLLNPKLTYGDAIWELLKVHPEDIPPMSTMESEAIRLGKHRLPLQIMDLRPRSTYRPPSVDEEMQLMTVDNFGKIIRKYVSAKGSWDGSIKNSTPWQPKHLKIEAAPYQEHIVPIIKLPQPPKRVVIHPPKVEQLKRPMPPDTPVATPEITNAKLPKLDRPVIIPNKVSAVKPTVPSTSAQVSVTAPKVVERKTVITPHPYRAIPPVTKTCKSLLTINNPPPIGQQRPIQPPPLSPVATKKVTATRFVPLYGIATKNAIQYRLKVIPVVRPLISSNFHHPRFPAITQHLHASATQILPIRASFVPTVPWSINPPPLAYKTPKKVIITGVEKPATSA